MLLFFESPFFPNPREPTKLFPRNPCFDCFGCKYSSLENDKGVKRTGGYLKCHRGLSSPFSSTPQYTLLKAASDDATSIAMVEGGAVTPIPISSNGIGIVEFFEGKTLLVTGATGFLAKALIEKMLRAIPKINKIYLIIRAKDKETALERLISEIVESKIFKLLEEMHGESYKLFMQSKLVPVLGNIHEPNLGMDLITAQQLAEEIDLIVDSAAITSFDERYDLALDANVNGPCQLMTFAKKCKKLKLLMHYSTAYANGEREGLIYEKPFTMGESITKERIISISPSTKFPSLHASSEIDLVSNLKDAITNNCLEQIMKELGKERAKFYGWQDTYSFTKAIGEMVINSMRDEVPILILRPSTIMSSYKEPFPGWIQGFRVADPCIFFYGKGELPGLLTNPEVFLDIVPVDMVVNATIAAIAKHGYLQSPGVNVYHLASTFVNPLSYSQMFDYCYEYFRSFPIVNSKGDKVQVRKMRYFDRISDFSNFIWEELSRTHGIQDLTKRELPKIQKRIKRKVEILKYICQLYEPYAFYEGCFHNGNVRKLMEDMSEEEKTSFEMDVTKINWKNYLINTHIPGVQEHVIKKRAP